MISRFFHTIPISIHLITSNNIASLERKHDRTVLLYRNEPFQPIFWDMKQIMNGRSAEGLRSEILKILKNSEVTQDFQVTVTNKAAENTTKNTINFWEKSKETNETLWRSKYEKLDRASIISIWEDLNQTTAAIKEIAMNYNWSRSTVYNIRKHQQYYINGVFKRQFEKRTSCENRMLENFIDEYVDSHQTPWTVKDIRDYLYEKTKKIYPLHIVRRIMINNLQLSFKKISSRPITYHDEVLKEARILFSIRYSQLPSHKTLLINVDEASIGRSCKIEYSWSHKGESHECQKISIVGSLKLILAVASSGVWFWIASHENINSK